jgi:hypothetical protein
VIGTDEFRELAALESRNRGLPDLPVVVVPHPLGGIAPSQALAKVEAALQPVVAALSAGAATLRPEATPTAAGGGA